MNDFTLDPWHDLDALLAFRFMVNALEAGTIVAVMAGLIGWFMVLRRQTFAGHTLAVMAFPGAAAATLAGLPILLGYFGSCAAGAVALAGLGRRGRGAAADSAAIGVLQASALAVGFVVVGLYHGLLTDLDALLFGTFLGITRAQVLVLLALALVATATLAAIGRPLLYASIDETVAGAAGVPVRRLSLAYLLLLAVAVAATSQITGALLIFALLVMPAATAQLITSRPAASLALTVAIALAVTWLGLGVAYFSIYPVGFYVTSLSFALYVLARTGRLLADRRAPS